MAGATGGAKAVALTTANMPAHSHTVNSHTHSTPNHTHTWANEANKLWSGNQALTSSRALIGVVQQSGQPGFQGQNGGGYYQNWSRTTAWMASSGGGTSGAASPATSSVGSGGAHDNMPPYVVANLWHRVA